MSDQIPFIDLVASHRGFKAEIEAAVARVFESQQFILGETVRRFEESFAQAFGMPRGSTVGVSSGTDALLVALMAAGVVAGDRVLTTPFSFFATAGTIARLGAIPVFADIDPETCNLSPAALSAHDPGDYRAVVVVHLYGRIADMAAIRSWAGHGGPVLIEDAAQAVAAFTADGRSAGLLGDFGCFSFFPTKNLGGAGDGGLVSAVDPERAGLVRKLRVHGAVRPYENEVVGGNFRLDALQAAVLEVKLRHIEKLTAARLDHARRYDGAFRGLAEAGLLGLPPIPADRSYNGHQYVLRSPRRDALKLHLAKQGIESMIYYPRPLHLLDCFRGLGFREAALPAAEAAAREVLALPVYPELGAAEQGRIIEAVKDFHTVC